MVTTPNPPTPAEWHLTETYKGLLTISVEALKMLALVNGGAAVALLTYIGNARSPIPGQPSGIRVALLCYSGGLFATILAFVVAYVTQLRLFQEEVNYSQQSSQIRRLHGFEVTCGIFLALVAAIAFGLGCLKAAIALIP